MLSAAARPTCPRCRRPASYCWCEGLAPVSTRTRVVFLQHVRESRVRIGTARMAHLALAGSELHVGTRFALELPARTAVLFPGEGALPPEALAEGEPWTLLVIDGTWSQARKLVERDPVLRALPRIGFRPERPGNYRIRREPSAECLATVEAVAEVLVRAEGGRDRFAPMIAAFTRMVDRQIAAAASAGARPRRRDRQGAPPPHPDLLRLRAAGSSLVLLHAEANAHPRGAGVPGPSELVHVVALRPFTGATFEAVLRPRRPLARATPHHLGLSAQALLAGEEAGAAIARLRAFLRPHDVVASRGRYPADLLAAEGFALDATVDLRALIARRLGRQPGPLEDALRSLGCTVGEPAGAGRAGRIVAALAAAAELLVAGG